MSAWLVTGYAEAKALLTGPDVVKGGPQDPHRDAVPARLSAAMDTHMLSADGAEHARLRFRDGIAAGLIDFDLSRPNS